MSLEMIGTIEIPGSAATSFDHGAFNQGAAAFLWRTRVTTASRLLTTTPADTSRRWQDSQELPASSRTMERFS